MRRRWAPPGRSSTVCVGLTDGSRTMETKAVLVDGCTAAVNKAIKDLERFQAEYATRPIPPPVDPLLLPIYTQLKREELRALLRSGLALANKNDSETNGHDNSLLLSAPVVFIDIILALFPLLFQRENMDRLAMLQVKRWTCLVSPKIDLQWLVQDSAASEYVNEYGRRTAVDPALDAQVCWSQAQASIDLHLAPSLRLTTGELLSHGPPDLGPQELRPLLTPIPTQPRLARRAHGCCSEPRRGRMDPADYVEDQDGPVPHIAFEQREEEGARHARGRRRWHRRARARVRGVGRQAGEDGLMPMANYGMRTRLLLSTMHAILCLLTPMHVAL
eukprot:m.61205 g.61205  ORF g.61205 m.61205 type:complete len:332 (+) comp7064_c0_seq2:114-1109(+)